MSVEKWTVRAHVAKKGENPGKALCDLRIANGFNAGTSSEGEASSGEDEVGPRKRSEGRWLREHREDQRETAKVEVGFC